MEKRVQYGRPRPQETIDRDKMILRLLGEGPKSRNRLIQDTGLKPSLVWLSLDRLRRAGEIKLCQGIGERVWTSNVNKPCP